MTPFCDGGEVFDVVADKGRFHEAEARSLFRQALEGLLFLKQHGVCHRCVHVKKYRLSWQVYFSRFCSATFGLRTFWISSTYDFDFDWPVRTWTPDGLV